MQLCKAGRRFGDRPFFTRRSRLQDCGFHNVWILLTVLDFSSGFDSHRPLHFQDRSGPHTLYVAAIGIACGRTRPDAVDHERQLSDKLIRSSPLGIANPEAEPTAGRATCLREKGRESFD